jgi:tRNA(Ile)-lysidine synthase TilS/MesJ
VIGTTGQTAVENAYDAHVDQLKTYNTTFPTIIRPMLRIDRAAVRDTATKRIIGYDHRGYNWISIAYQQPIRQAEADRRHIPR